jgi:hypothetical protein
MGVSSDRSDRRDVKKDIEGIEKKSSIANLVRTFNGVFQHGQFLTFLPSLDLTHAV